MTPEERLRRRRCLGLRVGVLFAVLLAVYYHGDLAVVGVASAGGLLALATYWRNCRRSVANSARTGTHTGDAQR
jgi:hypothetical protein